MESQKVLLLLKRALFGWSSFLSIKNKLETFIKKQKEIDNQDSFEQNMLEFQTNIIDQTIHSKIFEEFPPCTKSTKAFIKKLLLVFEHYQIEGHASLYDYVTNVEIMHTSKVNNFKTYFDESGNHLVSLVEKSDLICDGTTGLRTWQAGKFLFEWMSNNIHDSHRINNKSILELGSGVGYTGLCIFKDKKIAPRCVTLTDHHSSVLDTLCQNAIANVCKTQNTDQSKNENSQFVVTKAIEFPKRFITSDGLNKRILIIDCLDWEHFDAEESNSHMNACDIVIGADIVFDVSVIPHLIHVIIRFLKDLGTEKVILANCIRNEETDTFFMNELSKQNVDIIIEKHFVDEQLPLYLYIIQKCNDSVNE